MSDVSYIPSFFFPEDKAGQGLTYAQLEARRKIALALATRNRPYPKTIGEGLTALGEGLGEGYANARLARDEAAQIAGDAAALRPPSAVPGGGQPPPPPSVAPAVPRATPSGASAEADPAQVLALAATEKAQSDTAPLTPAQATQQPQMPVEEWLQRVARNETGGRKDAYSLVGERSRRGDYPYGKYQVMGENVPVWTKKYLGQAMTPEEFLANPKAQEQVARARGSEYIAKYGPVGAAAAWFAGPNGMNDETRKDTLGTHVAEYKRRFNLPLVSRNQIAAAVTPQDPESAAPYRVASLGDGTMVPETARPDAREMVAQATAGPAPVRVADAAPPVPLPSQAFVGPQLGQGGPRVPDFPAYKPEPKPPQPTADMIHYRRVAADPYRSDAARQTAMQLYTEMKAAQDQEFTRQYEFWKANDLKRREYDVNRPKMQEELTNAWLDSLKKPQGIIQQPYQQAQGPAPAQVGGAGGDDHDPRLGTPQSPQRSGIPTVPPVPPGIIPEKWAELQATEQANAVSAVQRAAPQFEDAIRSIQLARTHAGREYGLGLGGVIARQTPQTEAYAFGLINDQMKGKTFLKAYDTLKGGGAISNVEGDKAQLAQARIDPKQDTKNYDASLDELENQLRRDFEIAQRKVNAPVTAWKTKPDDPVAPDIGQPRTRNGQREKYRGGNPALDESWEKI